MAKVNKWEFWNSDNDYTENTIEIKECIKPERTNVWKQLVKQFNKGECKRIGYKIQEQNKN